MTQTDFKINAKQPILNAAEIKSSSTSKMSRKRVTFKSSPKTLAPKSSSTFSLPGRRRPLTTINETCTKPTYFKKTSNKLLPVEIRSTRYSVDQSIKAPPSRIRKVPEKVEKPYYLSATSFR